MLTTIKLNEYDNAIILHGEKDKDEIKSVEMHISETADQENVNDGAIIAVMVGILIKTQDEEFIKLLEKKLVQYGKNPSKMVKIIKT